MMHPHTRVQPISDQIGVGVVATRFIPAGTAVYQTDALDLRIAPNDPRLTDPTLAEHIETYSYLDPDGTRVMCWDIGKYVNHACTPNTLTSGYGFQIALRDLEPGEEILDDYGIYTNEFGPLLCNEPTCRGHIRPTDFLKLVPMWDAKLKPVLKQFFEVEQPLMQLIDADALADLYKFVKTGRGYRSIVAARNIDTLPVEPCEPKLKLNGHSNSHSHNIAV
jgi:hypothetical protein